MEESEKINVIDIKIVPNRYLKPNTTENILNCIYDLEGQQRVLIHGPSIPLKVFYGPGKGHIVNHTDRKIISVKDTDLELSINTFIGSMDESIPISKEGEDMMMSQN